jgi:hypothetical protein
VIVLFGGRRIDAKLFRAEIDTHGPIRLSRPVPLALEQKLETSRTKRPVTLAATLEAFRTAAAAGQGRRLRRRGARCGQRLSDGAGEIEAMTHGLPARSDVEGSRQPPFASPLAGLY